MLKFLNEINFSKKNKKFFLNKIDNIINDIKKYGDNSLKFYLKSIDGLLISKVNDLIIKKSVLKKIYKNSKKKTKKILKEILIRLKRYHFHNYINSWQIKKNKIIYGQKNSKIEKIGVYIPGGETIYPSSIFMNCIPSSIFKINSIYMITPIKKGLISNLLLSISYLNNIKEIIFIGGVHGVSCLVYGTETIKKIDKITGPGNYFVTKAKKEFFGIVGIDMLAGPSELIILCDGKIHPKIILFDFFSQLEHDKNSFSYLLSNNKVYLKLIYKLIYKNLIFQKNKKIIFYSLNNSFLLFKSIYNSIQLINYFSPEHLMLCIKKSNKILKFIKNSGVIFMNYNSCVTHGDFISGPSHVIPTNKTARFFSSLNINDFCKKIGIITNLNSNYSKIISSFFSKKEKFFSHCLSSIFRI